jgi:hypothetical protein
MSRKEHLFSPKSKFTNESVYSFILLTLSLAIINWLAELTTQSYPLKILTWKMRHPLQTEQNQQPSLPKIKSNIPSETNMCNKTLNAK